MPNLSQYGLFVAATLALLAIPGPSMIYIITRGIAYGRKAGIVSAFGDLLGILVHTIAVALGLSLVLQTSAMAFMVVKYMGALYLIYLGIKATRSKNIIQLDQYKQSVSARALFWQGTLSSILNPKTAIFFIAFLPQFVNKSYNNIEIQLLALGITFAIIALCVGCVIAYFAGTIGNWLAQQQRVAKALPWVTGSILVGLGVRLALQD